MAFVDYDIREVDLKIAWVGPSGSGKTTALRAIEDTVANGLMEGWVPARFAGDKPMLFELLPLRARAIEGFGTRFELMTLPDGRANATTRRHLMRDLDGVVFMADSQWGRMEDNAREFAALSSELAECGHDFERMPIALLYNKRDHPEAAPLKYMEYLINNGHRRLYSRGSVASTGEGLIEGLNAIAKCSLAMFEKDPQIELIRA